MDRNSYDGEGYVQIDLSSPSHNRKDVDIVEKSNPLNMKFCRMTECRAGDIRWYDYGAKNPKDRTRVCQGWRPVIIMATFYKTVTFVPLTTSEKFDVCGVSLTNITEDSAIEYPRFDLVTTVMESDLARPPRIAAQYIGNVKDNYPDAWKTLVNFYRGMLLGDIRYEDLVCKKRHELLENDESSATETEEAPARVDVPAQESVTTVPEVVEVQETKPEPKPEITGERERLSKKRQAEPASVVVSRCLSLRSAKMTLLLSLAIAA